MSSRKRSGAMGFDDPVDRLRLMEAVVGAGVDAIVVTEITDDGEPIITFVNDAFTTQTGWTREEVVGEHPRLLVSEETAVEPQLELRRAVEERVSTSVELLHRRRDGSTFWVDNTVVPVMGGGRCTHIVSFQRDVTERKEAERAVHESEARFRSLAEHVSDVISVIEADGHIRYTSPSSEWVLGHPLGSYSSVFELIHPDDQEMVSQLFVERISQPGLGDAVELRLAHGDGSWREVEVLTNNLLDDPVIAGVVVTVRDITERKRIERMLAGQAKVLELLLAGRPPTESLAAVARLAEEQSPGTQCAILRHHVATGQLSCIAAPNLPAAYVDAVQALDPLGPAACAVARRDATPVVVTDVTSGLSAELTKLIGKAGCWAIPVCDADGAVIAILAAYHDHARQPSAAEWQVIERMVGLIALVMERDRATAELAHRATHDPITELPNRSLLLDRMRLSVARLDRRSRSLAVLAISIDRLDRIADSMGHHEAEDVIITIAGRLKRVLRPEDTVGDLGGGVFIVVSETTQEARGAVAVAERVAQAIASPHVLPDGPVFLTGSIGIALGTASTANADVLIDDAVTAMRRASESGGGRYELFDSGLRDRVVERVRVENGLHRALQRGELVLHYQPVTDLSDGRPASVEALVRWIDPDRGLVPPAEFIPIAEDTGLIVPLGAWALETATRQLAAWKLEGLIPPGFSMAVNVSPRQLRDGLVETVVGSIAAVGLARGELCVEVTESTVMSQIDVSLDVLRRIRAAGVQVAIDDFGTGQSSLGLLRQLPVDVLKIDRTFVGELDDSLGSPIPAIVVNLAHGLGLTAVAEGVETVEQEEALRAIGCDRSQGYLRCPPLPADEVARWLRRALASERPAPPVSDAEPS